MIPDFDALDSNAPERQVRRSSDNEHWHLDKKVPITMIFALLMQAAVGIWWASKLESRIDGMEVRFADQHSKDLIQDQVIVENRNERNARLDRLEFKLDSLIVRLSERVAR